MNDGYLDWLALAPEGKVPVRTGTGAEPGQVHRRLGAYLQTGVEHSKPLSELYPSRCSRNWPPAPTR